MFALALIVALFAAIVDAVVVPALGLLCELGSSPSESELALLLTITGNGGLRTAAEFEFDRLVFGEIIIVGDAGGLLKDTLGEDGITIEEGVLGDTEGTAGPAVFIPDVTSAAGKPGPPVVFLSEVMA